jgi:YVTN family beta-propeller protein
VLFGTLGAAACAPRKGRVFPGYAFVANSGARSVAAVDLTRFALARQIGVEAAPSQVLAHTERAAVLVLIPETGTVYEIGAASLAVAGKARTGSAALSMRLSHDGKSLWVLQPRALWRLDTGRLKPLQSVRLPAAAVDFDLSADGRAAICLPQEGTLLVLRLDTGAVEHMIPAGAEPAIVRFQSDGKQILTGSPQERLLSIFDTATGRIVVRLPLPVEPANFCFNSDGGQLFVTGAGMDAVSIVYPYRSEVGETILAGRMPGAMAVTAVPPYLFVANPESAGITVLDIDTRKLVAPVTVGQEPRHIVITPDNQYALVLNHGSGDMAVVRIEAFRARRHRTDPAPLFTMIPVGEQPVSAAVVRLG